MMVYFNFLNVIFNPLLGIPPLLAVILMSLIISVIVIFITKYTTNQSLMKKLKDDLKDYQKQVKELKNEPTKAMEVQKKAMEANMEYMKHSLKPTIITFIPIILLFGWMSSNFAYESIKPQQEFSVSVIFDKDASGYIDLIAPENIVIIGNKTAKITEKIENGIFSSKKNYLANWTLKGTEGEHILEFDYNGEKEQKDVLITNSDKYIEPAKKISNGQIKSIQINYKQRKILNLFGWKLGWLGTYIIFSIIFTMALRKVMKVY